MPVTPLAGKFVSKQSRAQKGGGGRHLEKDPAVGLVSSWEGGTPCALLWSLCSAHGRGAGVGGCATIPVAEEFLGFVLVKRCELPMLHQGDTRCI